MNIPTRVHRLQPLLLELGRAREYLPRDRVDRGPPLTRVRHGVYLEPEVWESCDATDRHLVRILAARSRARDEPVFSHGSAAALLGLPLYRGYGDRVHVVGSSRAASRASGGVVRHRARLEDDDMVEVGGLLCTSPERTLIDLARARGREDALAAADGYLREAFRVDRSIDEASLAEWVEGMSARPAALRGTAGARAVREVLALADPRKDSVLESVSHLRLRQLGFEVAVQVRVAGPNGYDYWVDFEFVGLRLFGECDGKAKYTDPRLLQGMTPADLVYREKRRQEWICRTRAYEMIRWGAPDVATVLIFARFLRAFRVPIPRPPWGL